MGFSDRISKLKKKYLPKELLPEQFKELRRFKSDVKGVFGEQYKSEEFQKPPPESTVPVAPPPETIDEDAIRVRDRRRRLARRATQTQTSMGSAYSADPKRLLGS